MGSFGILVLLSIISNQPDPIDTSHKLGRTTLQSLEQDRDASMTTVNPIPISPLALALETHDRYYLPPSSSSLDHFHQLEEEEEEPRGRDTSPRPLPNLHSRSVSPARPRNPLEFTRRKSSSSIQSAIIQAHHTLPTSSSESAFIPSDPVLYLPPLLSPLPASLRHPDPHSGAGPSGPYHPDDVEFEFATRLPDIDPASLALHQVLHGFRPLDQNYSTTGYDQAFNWADIVRLRLLPPLHPSSQLPASCY